MFKINCEKGCQTPELDFGGLLGAGPVMPISQISNDVMINRGGRIPAPLQALKN